MVGYTLNYSNEPNDISENGTTPDKTTNPKLYTTGPPAQNTKVPPTEKYIVKHCNDFTIGEPGKSPEWNKAEWMSYRKIDSGGAVYATKSKMLYSDKGIYVLFTGDDQRITTKDYQDFQEIYEGDVFEVFFRPDPSQPQYFEYEINALNRELILTLTRTGNKTLAWSPWFPEYRSGSLVQKNTAVAGGEKKVGAPITGWTAEFFLPYQLLALLPGVAPHKGDIWAANLGRIDYDSGHQVQYSWSRAIQKDFHELEHFGQILFD